MTAKSNPTREKVGVNVTILRRGKVWWAEYYRNGEQRRQSLRTRSKKQAKVEAVRLDNSLLSGEHAKPKNVLRLDGAVPEYLNYLRTEGRRPSTITRYEPELRRFVKFAECKGVKMLDEVTVRLVDQYRAWRQPQVRPKTLHHETVVVRQLVNHFLARGAIDTDPLRGLRVKKPRPRRQPVYSIEDVENILRVAEPAWRPVFAALAFTGMRFGELSHITWDDVDIVRKWLHIRAKDGWLPKNGKERKVPLSDEALAVFKEMPRNGRWVFQGKRSGTTPLRVAERDALKALKRTLKKAEIAEGRLHSFRHFFISHAANQGVPAPVLLRWVGQSDLSMILHYYHLADGESQSAMGSVTFGGKRGQKGTSQNKYRNEDSDNENTRA